MALPKVTLLAEEWTDYTLIFGRGNYLFVGGKTKSVPHAVALFCKKKKDQEGNKMFKVEEMTDIVVPAKERKTVKQNVEEGIDLGHVSQLCLVESALCH